MTINLQLADLYNEDKTERLNAESSEDLSVLLVNTRSRLKKLREIIPTLDESEIWNCHYVAYLLQHGESTNDYKLAREYAKKAVALGSRVTKWLYAATLDRLLISQGKLQKYGTQYQMINGEKVYAESDGTISESEKIEHGVI